MAEHTPTPWTQHGLTIMAHGVRDLVVICDGDHARGTREEGLANAALIVRAVNSHDALVKALRLVAEHDTAMARLEPDAHDAVLAALALSEQGEL